MKNKKLYSVNIWRLVFLVAGLTIVVMSGIFLLIIKVFIQESGQFDQDLKTGLEKRILQKKDESLTPAEKILKGINSNRSRVVKIYQKENNHRKLINRGVVYSPTGGVLTVDKNIEKGMDYEIMVPGKKKSYIAKAKFIKNGLALFQLNTEFGLVAEFSEKIMDEGDLVAGISGGEKEGLASGIIKKYQNNNELILTTIPQSVLMPGTPLVNQEGKIIGIYSGNLQEGSTVFLSATKIKATPK